MQKLPRTSTLIFLLIFAFASYGGPEETMGKANCCEPVVAPTASKPITQTLPTRSWRKVLATWYGPGFYGNHTACGQRMTPRLRGIAHPALPCGTAIALRKGSVRVNVRVVDRGPYSGADIDLTARTAQDLCRCVRPYTMRVWMKRTWR